MSIIYDLGGLKLRLLFGRWGYAPHYAEHVIDPVDGREKLLLADPHIRHSVYIYDLNRGVIEWEYRVPGEQVVNPHIAHMVTDDNPVTGPYWSSIADKINAGLGDIVCADRDNRLIVIDRVSKKIKNVIKIPDTKWLHEVLPSKQGDGLIVSDYSSGWFRKIGFDGSVKWSLGIEKAAKASTIYARASTHIESFGGDYLFVSNSEVHGVYEVNENGEVEWMCPCRYPCVNATWMYHPHSAFRYGLAEAGGNLTIIGFEGGGGVIGVDRECRPRLGFMKVHTNMVGDQRIDLYRPTMHGFMETTHVFPLLNGGIGVIDWRGKYSSLVYEIIGFPSKTTLYWLLAWDVEASHEWLYLDPPIEVSEWDKTILQFINLSEHILEWEIITTNMPQLYHWDYPTHWFLEYSNKVKPRENDQYIVADRTAIRVRVRALEEGVCGKFKIVVQQIRG
ncbi:MAG: hypothetical protein B6U89_06540 [Desulfurococcales archaeon ex4484_58]|nr:MAG: hypothetical protein B6U89_06540 [Desulfurococcales archaeon ex4484_58]